mmetsp:Transcript_4917/g.11921  ORF Transcript_4917/g.11921 Transcript_4917/m.11921 type:complete len:297 (-) Transcript_4917:175-1065(-)
MGRLAIHKQTVLERNVASRNFFPNSVGGVVPWRCVLPSFPVRDSHLLLRRTSRSLKVDASLEGAKTVGKYAGIDLVSQEESRSRARLAVFVSGGGSNLRAIQAAISRDEIRGDIVTVVSDVPGCGGWVFAESLSIPTLTYPTPRKGESASQGLTSDELVHALKQHHRVDYVVLAGYLKLVPSELVRAYPRSMINIHPALLPAFGGKGCYGSRVHKMVVESGVRFTGPTVHFVDEEYDAGVIIAQRCVPVFPWDTPDEVAARVLKQEHEVYPEVISALVDGRITFRSDGVPVMWTAR